MLSKSFLLLFVIGLYHVSPVISQNSSSTANTSVIISTDNATTTQSAVSGNSSSPPTAHQGASNTTLEANGTSEQSSQNTTSDYLLQEPVLPLKARGIELFAGKPLAVPLSYPGSGLLVISLAEYEGAAVLTVVSNLSQEAMQNPLIESSLIPNKYLSRTVQLKGDSGSQVYLLLNQTATIEKELTPILMLKTSFISGAISPQNVFSVPKDTKIEWSWDAKSNKLSAAWPKLDINATNYASFEQEISRSHQILISYSLIGTIKSQMTRGVAMFNMRVDGHTGLIQASVNASLTDRTNKVIFDFHPSEPEYFFTVVAKVSKVLWNNHTQVDWETEYVYPITEYKVPAEYLAAYKNSRAKENADREIEVVNPPVEKKGNNMRFLTTFTMFIVTVVVILLLLVIVKIRQSIAASHSQTQRPLVRADCEDNSGYIELKSTRFARYDI